MYEISEHLIQEVERGRLSRREAVSRLVAVAAATFAGAAAPTPAGAVGDAPTFRSRGLNHIALRVTDIPRSRTFYQRHLGLELLRESGSNCFLGAGGNNFVALFRSSQAGLDHYCYTVDDYDATQVVDKLESAGLDPVRRENRVYFDDPDGLEVQLAGEWNDFPGRP